MRHFLLALLLSMTVGFVAASPARIADPVAAIDEPAVAATDIRPMPLDAAAQMEQMKAVIRQDATASYGGYCLGVSLPDSAFVPIELSGGGLAELAVFYSQAECPRMGASGFSGTGGSLVQFWGAAHPEGPVRLLLERHVEGFTPGDRRLVTLQHGGHCGVAGALGCRIVYRWDDDRFEVAEKRPGDPDRPFREAMVFDGWRAPAASARPADGTSDMPPPPSHAEQIERMKLLIRQDAQQSYGRECGLVTIPDRAFIPVELGGDDFPELAVSFNRVLCPARGLTNFSGTGGVMMQFWRMNRGYDGSSGPVRLLLEQQMHGFSPSRGGLVTMQHGIACPGGAGPDQCRVVYRWDDREHRLDVTERRLASSLGQVPPMVYGYETISR